MELSNQFISLAFDPSSAKLTSYFSKAHAREYLCEGGCQLFRLTLVEVFEGKILPGRLRLTAETAERTTFESSGDGLAIRFYQLDGMNIDVTARITLDGEAVRWELSVKNGTEFAVKAVEYPWLMFRTPLGECPERERILLPKQDGVLFGNPALHPWHKDEERLMNERYWYPGDGQQYPKNVSAQMTAYYDDRGGILLYTADTEGNVKRLGPILRSEHAIDLAPEHMRPEVEGLDFTLGYPVVTCFFTGDWQDAALCYKQWAKTAPWCRKTVSDREDIPGWIKKGAFFFNFRLRYQDGGEAFLDRVPDFVSAWQKELRIPMVAMMTGWEKIGEWAGPDYFPPYGGERFHAMCRELTKRGIRPFAFGLSANKLLIRRLVPKAGLQPELAVKYNAREKFREEYIKSAALDENGVPYIESDLDAWDGVHGYACIKTEQAMHQICGASEKLLQEYGVKVEQADQVLGAGTICCYSKEHGHTPGYGSWQIEALRNIYKETRNRCKAKDPDFALSEEWANELVIPYLDLYHARNYDKPQGGLESVPLFSFLYHEYLPCYAGDWTPFLPGNESGVHFAGWNFVNGNLPAGSPIDMLHEMKNHPPEDADPRIMEMARNACKAFLEHTDFLVQGRQLPTAPIDVKQISLTIKGLDFGWERPERNYPGVLHRFWEAPDGRRGLALANITEEPLTVTVPADGIFEAGETLSADRNGEPDGSLTVNEKGIQITVLPREAVFVCEVQLSTGRSV